MFVTGLGEVLHVNASENIQEMTRGKQKHFWFPKKNKLKKIPSYYTRVYYRNTCYYYHNGFFYRPCSKGCYERFRPYVGMLVPFLPRNGIRELCKNGQEFLVCEGVIYKKISIRGVISYKIVGFV